MRPKDMLHFGLLIASMSPQAPVKMDLRYMQQAVYIAGSKAQDPEAPGGFGPSDRYPQPVRNSSLLSPKGPKATLSATKTGLNLHLTNGGEAPAWIPAADSNLLGYLEAQNKLGEWRPIEYKPWYSCGNSYHRVQLPSGYGWTFDVFLPEGAFKTKVRWRCGRSGEPLLSNTIAVSIPETRFSLEPRVERVATVNTDGGFPTLMPKRENAPPPTP